MYPKVSRREGNADLLVEHARPIPPAAALGELLAVVGDDREDRVLLQPELLQSRQQLGGTFRHFALVTGEPGLLADALCGGCQHAVVEELLEGRQGRMEAEESVEIETGIGAGARLVAALGRILDTKRA